MNYTQWYSNNFEHRLQGRYITLKHLQPLLSLYQEYFNISSAGTSELGKEIPLLSFGQGVKKVLIWSQMHGNESTTTKALFDFFKFITSNEKISASLFETYTFFVIPILNPDGAALYTRENARKIDLNRDAQNLSQNESKMLRGLFDQIQPDLCLNMHDQRTIYGLEGGFPATLSFLAPAADAARKITPARQEAMELIAKMHAYVSNFCPNQIGRYDDGFNMNCVGDTFTSLGVPTILFEAGHFHNDYNRENVRSYIFYALVSLFNLDNTREAHSVEHYLSIPENQKNFQDIVLKNVSVIGYDTPQTLCFQYEEVLVRDKVVFELYLKSIEIISEKYGHYGADLQGSEVLLNSQRNFAIGQKISTIFDVHQKLMLI